MNQPFVFYSLSLLIDEVILAGVLACPRNEESCAIRTSWISPFFRNY